MAFLFIVKIFKLKCVQAFTRNTVMIICNEENFHKICLKCMCIISHFLNSWLEKQLSTNTNDSYPIFIFQILWFSYHLFLSFYLPFIWFLTYSFLDPSTPPSFLLYPFCNCNKIKLPTLQESRGALWNEIEM